MLDVFCILDLFLYLIFYFLFEFQITYADFELAAVIRMFIEAPFNFWDVIPANLQVFQINSFFYLIYLFPGSL